MNHPSIIRPQDHASYSTAKMGKSTIFESPRLLVGLNAFEPGQEHAVHAHAGQDKVYQVIEGEGLFLLEGRELAMKTGDLLVAPEGVPRRDSCRAPPADRPRAPDGSAAPPADRIRADRVRTEIAAGFEACARAASIRSSSARGSRRPTGGPTSTLRPRAVSARPSSASRSGRDDCFPRRPSRP